MALFRVLMSICPNLEHFEFLKKESQKSWYPMHLYDVNSTMDILESLPTSLKSAYAGFSLNMESSKDVKILDKRMSTFLNISRNLTSVR